MEVVWRQYRARTWEGAVKGGGGDGGGMYRAVATCHCGWGHGSRGPGLGTRGWQKRRHCGRGMCPRHRALLSWSAMGRPL